MSSDEFPIKELRESLKLYSEAKTKAGLYQQRLCDEAEKLFSHFIRYAKENAGEPRGFSNTVEAFYYDVLNMTCDFHDRTIRSSLTKRFKKLMKKSIGNNSDDQVKLDDFML